MAEAVAPDVMVGATSSINKQLIEIFLFYIREF
jgi:hypothetical protein